MPAKAGLLGYVVLSFAIRWCNRNKTTKCLKRLQKRSIDDNLRQLVLIRQDRVLVKLSACFFTSDSDFFFYFSKRMGRSGDGKRNILWGWPKKNPVELKHRETPNSCRVFYVMKLKPEKERYYLILLYDYATWKSRIGKKITTVSRSNFSTKAKPRH